jgi:small-conductance mechanosensitive channel
MGHATTTLTSLVPGHSSAVAGQRIAWRQTRLLLEVARADGNALQDPPPSVIFRGFGDSALDFELCVWTDELYDRPSQFQSPLYFAIFDTFKRHGVEIPFPQRDLHVKGPVTIASSS